MSIHVNPDEALGSVRRRRRAYARTCSTTRLAWLPVRREGIKSLCVSVVKSSESRCCICAELKELQKAAIAKKQTATPVKRHVDLVEVSHVSCVYYGCLANIFFKEFICSSVFLLSCVLRHTLRVPKGPSGLGWV